VRRVWWGEKEAWWWSYYESQKKKLLKKPGILLKVNKCEESKPTKPNKA